MNVGQLGAVSVPPNASAAEEISSPPGVSASPERLPLAGFWRRAVACLIDTILIVLLFLFCASFFPSILAKLPPRGTTSFTDLPQPAPIVVALLAALQCAYYTVFEGSSWQATPGKRVMRLYVTNLNGQRITFGRALLRNLARQISGFLFIGYLVAGFTEKKQALHDILASSLVLRRP